MSSAKSAGMNFLKSFLKNPRSSLKVRTECLRRNAATVPVPVATPRIVPISSCCPGTSSRQPSIGIRSPRPEQRIFEKRSFLIFCTDLSRGPLPRMLWFFAGAESRFVWEKREKSAFRQTRGARCYRRMSFLPFAARREEAHALPGELFSQPSITRCPLTARFRISAAKRCCPYPFGEAKRKLALCDRGRERHDRGMEGPSQRSQRERTGCRGVPKRDDEMECRAKNGCRTVWRRHDALWPCRRQ